MKATVGSLLLLLAVGVPNLSRAGESAASGLPRVEFETYTLANGLRVILHVDRKLPVVHVNQWFHVGSKNERVGRSGFAHLFEHLMFEGSKNAPQKYFGYAEKAGANLFEGGVNGTTDWDRTNYFATVPSGSLEYLLWLESDRLATLDQVIAQASLDNQRDVVKNERRQGLENVPYGRWFLLVAENLFPYRHPYANDVIGSHADLTAATLDDVRDFYRTYYRPNNLSLVVAGDFDPPEAKRLVEKYFGGIPAGPPLDRTRRLVPPRLEGERVVEAADRVPQERTYFAWLSPPYFEAGDAELSLLSTILTDGLSARLNKALVYDRQLCSDAVSFQSGSEAAGFFVLWVTARPGASLAEIETLVDREIARVARDGPTSAELERARTKWEYGFVTGLERIGGFGGKADRLNQYATYLGDPGRFEADVERHRRVTTESLRKSVAEWLDPRNRLRIRFRPETSSRESTLALDRSAAPPLGADRPFAPPAVNAARLGSGLDVLVVERSDLPKVSVSMVTRSGSVDDSAGKAGTAGLLVSTIKLGTKTRTALEIEQALGDLGTSISGSAERERSSIGLEVLKRNLDPALAILADVVRNPLFPEAELAREKKLRLDNLMQEAEDPQRLAFRIAPRLAFGPEHPYGRLEVPATIGAVTAEDLRRLHAEQWKPGASALVFVGDVTLSEARGLADRHLGGWAGGTPAKVSIPAPRPVGPGKIYLVDRQGATQTVMLGILPGLSRTDPDYYALRLADAAFGGTASARLSANLREEKGYSYGVFSFPIFLSRAGAWDFFGGVQTDKTRESVAEVMKETRMLAGEKPITATELSFAKASRVRGYAQQFESLGRIGGQVAELWSLHLPMEELREEPLALEATTLEAVNATARKQGAPSGLTLLLVGDRAKIEPGLRELRLGELVALDTDGKPVVP